MSELKSNTTMPALCTDVLTIILEKWLHQDLYPMHHPGGYNSFLKLRLLSKQMNDLVVPVSYREIRIGSGILECFKTYLYFQPPGILDHLWYPHRPERIRDQLKVVEYVRTYTQHIWFGCDELEWPLVPGMLNSLKNLKHITWSYWGSSDGVEPSIQYAVLACPLFRARWPKLRISVTDFYNEEAVPFYPLLVNLVSCTSFSDRVSSPDVSSAHVARIKNMLLASPKMEVFDLIFNNSDNVIVDWDIREGEKLPPFKVLKLRGVDWGFSLVEAVDFWDWSKITHLTMEEVPIIPFLNTVPPAYLSGLRTFETDCWQSGNNVEEASRLLCNLVQQIATLERLATKCRIKYHINQCLPAIIKHGPILRSLSLRDFHGAHDFWGPQNNPDSHSVLSIKKLTALRYACPNLMELELDIKLDLKDFDKSRNILTTTLALFRNLRRLRLYTWVPYPTSATSWSEGVEQFKSIVEDLIFLKQGAEFDRLGLYLAPVDPTVQHGRWAMMGGDITYSKDIFENDSYDVHVRCW